MLEIRPTCEHCMRELSPDSPDAMICSYECTFCQACVEGILENVCPNCGGGFTKRPIRPQNEWRKRLSRAHQKPVEITTHKPVNPEDHCSFAKHIKHIHPTKR
jgi:hypothetical protein